MANLSGMEVWSFLEMAGLILFFEGSGISFLANFLIIVIHSIYHIQITGTIICYTYLQMSIPLEKPNLSVIMPAYNEAGNVEIVISKAISYLDNFAEHYEIIMINDGSTDDTGKIIKRLAESNPKIHPIHHPQNQGYGAAVRSGFREARMDYIFLTDADGQFDFQELTEVFPHLTESDFIIGYRLTRQDAYYRKINTYLWNVLCRIIFRTRVKDIDCAFKLFKRQILDSIELKANGAMVSTELLIKARKAGFKIVEMGVHHYPRLTGKASGANPRVVYRAFKEIIQLYPELH